MFNITLLYINKYNNILAILSNFSTNILRNICLYIIYINSVYEVIGVGSIV